MNWTRTIFAVISVALAGLFLGTAYAQSDSYRWKLAHQWPTVHYYHTAAETFVKRVEERTEGRLRIDIYPAGQLFGMREIPEALINGSLDLGMAADVGYSGYVPTVAVFDLPMLVPDGAAMFRLLSGEFGETLAADLKAKGMTHLAWVDYGPMSFLTGSRAINKPEDLEGLRITVPGGLFAESVAALGGTPVSTPPSDHYIALQRNIVSGILIGPSSMTARKLHEAQKNFTAVNVAWPVHIMTANTAALESLPTELASIVREEARALQDWVAAQTEEQTQKAIAAMSSAGIVVHKVPAEELPQWRAKLLPVHEKFVGQAGPAGKKLLDMATGGK
ncbi:TRAP transporter substrate-binding protein [Thauera chlorobenzoica]|uniref:TRAP-type C4-dicarboxylate transport system, periplasmic component n=1 Tax=Thauera chlorobenzoica TaxID=96773 RepID=A0A1H5YF16_9RHOO|nr:TRAP transporter substrate-binding protein [Thauera chlorobenzoica]APR05930.1 TRAP-type C4-dicarboxylate transport system, periplasmic component [Thauera chlorobenzoica]SEG22322.1 TRAP-type C4-dicarboxylate transport system, substrate-binding protein [Thauera chlorobenzoica]